MQNVVRSVTFLPDGSIGIEFVNKGDVKVNGMQRDQVLFVPGGDEYDDEIDAVKDSVNELLNDALEDFPRLEEFDPRSAAPQNGEDDDDDDV